MSATWTLRTAATLRVEAVEKRRAGRLQEDRLLPALRSRAPALSTRPAAEAAELLSRQRRRSGRAGQVRRQSPGNRSDATARGRVRPVAQSSPVRRCLHDGTHATAPHENGSTLRRYGPEPAHPACVRTPAKTWTSSPALREFRPLPPCHPGFRLPSSPEGCRRRTGRAVPSLRLPSWNLLHP